MERFIARKRQLSCSDTRHVHWVEGEWYGQLPCGSNSRRYLEVGFWAHNHIISVSYLAYWLGALT